MSEEVTINALVWSKTAEFWQAGDPQKHDYDYGYRIYQVKGGEHDGMHALYFYHSRGEWPHGSLVRHSPSLEECQAVANLNNYELQTNDPNPLRGPETRGTYTITID